MVAEMLQKNDIELNIRAFGKRDKGAPGGDAVINWGISGSDERPTLNAKANGSKYEQLLKLEAKGVLVPKAVRLFERGREFRLPALARRDRHAGGTDIIVIKGPAGLTQIPRDYAYLTELIDSDAEFRTWIFREKHLVTYEKVKKRDAERPGFGRNYAQGYGFDRRDDAPEGVMAIGIAAVRALDLDFGAVDILHGTDGRYYVLEVNTAPRIESPSRTCAQRLVRELKGWIRAGFPAR